MDPKKEPFSISFASKEESKDIEEFTLSIVVGLGHKNPARFGDPIRQVNKVTLNSPLNVFKQ